jgi:hypothetical protein
MLDEICLNENEGSLNIKKYAYETQNHSVFPYNRFGT